MNEEITIEEIRQMLENRLAKLLVLSKNYHEELSSPILSKHAQGYIDAIEGTFGEQKFLNELIERLK